MVAARRSNARIVALTRIVLCAIFMSSAEPTEALVIARGGSAAWSAPEGLGWFLAHVPITDGVATFAYRVYFTCACFGLLGLYTRLSLTGLLASAFYLFSVRQMTGVVLHDMHLLWLLSLLVFASSGTCWSLDAWLRSRGSRETGALRTDVHRAFLFWSRTLLGLVYFFPGLWKLRAQGLGWALSDNLQNQLWAKWFQYGTLPSLRLDLHPQLLHVLGLGTLVFELGFIVLVHLGPRMRLVLGVGGILFHLAIERFMFIPFASLWLMYVVLLGGDHPKVHVRRVYSLGATALTFLVLVQGFRGRTQSYPFACYPTFQDRAETTLPDMVVTVSDEEGRERVVPMARDAAGHRSQLAWGEVWSVLGVYGVPLSETRLRAYVARELARANVRAARVRVEIGYFQTDPARWGEAPRETATVAAWVTNPF